MSIDDAVRFRIVVLGQHQEMATLPRRMDGQFEYCHSWCAEAPMTGVRDMPRRGPNNEEPARSLD